MSKILIVFGFIALSFLAVLYPRKETKITNAYVKKRIRKSILKECEDRSKSRKAEFLESLESGKLD